VCIIHGDRTTPFEPCQDRRPGGVARPPDLGPRAGARQRPPSIEPLSIGFGGRVAEPFGAGLGVDQDEPGPVAGLLGDVQRDVVQPLVGDGQAVDPGGDGGTPVDLGWQARRPRGQVDGRHPESAAQFGVGRAEHPADEHPLAGADVDQVELARHAELRVHLHEQGQHGLGEHRRGADRGAEVT
jgi:hypothetical protein